MVNGANMYRLRFYNIFSMDASLSVDTPPDVEAFTISNPNIVYTLVATSIFWKNSNPLL